MENQTFSESVNTLRDHLKEYLDMRIRLFRLIMVEKLSRLSSLLILFILIMILLLFAGGFLCLAFVLWFGEHAGPMWAGALIVVGVILLKLILLLIFRKKMLLNPIIRQLSKIIMEDPENE